LPCGRFFGAVFFAINLMNNLNMNVSETQSRSWDLSSEINLLNAILECGFENWTAVAKFVAPFSAKECEDHYMNKFILEPDIKELRPTDVFREARRRRQLCSNGCKCFIGRDLRFKNVLSVSQVVEKENSLRELDKSKSLIDPISVTNDEDKSGVFHKKGKIFYAPFACQGYNPERSEFDIEYDDKAELTLSLLHEAQGDVATFDNEEDNEFYGDLQLALVNSYNFRLAERERRKRIIRTHALLDRRKTYNMLQRYEVLFSQHYL
jgi:transcriptional adapter 2-alpha